MKILHLIPWYGTRALARENRALREELAERLQEIDDLEVDCEAYKSSARHEETTSRTWFLAANAAQEQVREAEDLIADLNIGNSFESAFIQRRVAEILARRDRRLAGTPKARF